jgi:hypothetical protein
MRAGKYNLYLEQGVSLRKEFRCLVTGDPDVAVDFTGYTARMQVRESHDSADALLDLTTENGGIEALTDNGVVALVFTPAMTEGATWRRAVYDIEIYSGSTVMRILQGSVRLSPEVTRDD